MVKIMNTTDGKPSNYLINPSDSERFQEYYINNFKEWAKNPSKIPSIKAKYQRSNSRSPACVSYPAYKKRVGSTLKHVKNVDEFGELLSKALCTKRVYKKRRIDFVERYSPMQQPIEGCDIKVESPPKNIPISSLEYEWKLENLEKAIQNHQKDIEAIQKESEMMKDLHIKELVSIWTKMNKLATDILTIGGIIVLFVLAGVIIFIT